MDNRRKFFIMITPNHLIHYNFPPEEGRSFLIRTNPRKEEYEEYLENYRSNISIHRHTLQILHNNEIVKEYDGIDNPWSLIVRSSTGDSTFASPFFKHLYDNESIYLEKKITLFLNPETTTIINNQYNENNTIITLKIINNYINLTIDNKVINNFENMPKGINEYNEWEELINQTIGQQFPLALNDKEQAINILIQKEKETKNNSQEHMSTDIKIEYHKNFYTIN